jgi:hypothetical protein
MAYKEFLPKQSALGSDWIVCDCVTTWRKMATKIGKVVAVIHRIEDSPSFVGFEGRTYPFFYYYLQCIWKPMNKVRCPSNTYFHWLPNLKSINFGHKFTMWWLLLLYRLTLSYEIISGLKQYSTKKSLQLFWFVITWPWSKLTWNQNEIDMYSG